MKLRRKKWKLQPKKEEKNWREYIDFRSSIYYLFDWPSFRFHWKSVLFSCQSLTIVSDLLLLCHISDGCNRCMIVMSNFWELCQSLSFLWVISDYFVTFLIVPSRSLLLCQMYYCCVKFLIGMSLYDCCIIFLIGVSNFWMACHFMIV